MDNNQNFRDIILDFGYGYSKFGYSGDTEPLMVFPTVIGEPNYPTVNPCGRPYASPAQKGYGIQVESKFDKLQIHHLFKRGKNFGDDSKDEDRLVETLYHIFQNQMNIDPSQHRFLVTEIPLNTKSQREKFTQILFETFDISALYIACQSVLSLYSTGKSTGIVLESGYSVSHIVPVYQGYILPHAISRLDIGGLDIDNYLTKILNERGFTFSTTKQSTYGDFKDRVWIKPTCNLPLILKEIKMNHCNIPFSLENELIQRQKDGTSNELLEITIPNGGKAITGSFKDSDNFIPLSRGGVDDLQLFPTTSIITIPTYELLLSTELLFNPSIIGIDSKGIHELLYDSILKCDSISQQKEMYNNILICGGNTMIQGFDQRLKSEFKKMVPSNIEINYLASPINKRNLTSYYGASSLISTNFNLWITKDEYNEIGPTIVDRLLI